MVAQGKGEPAVHFDNHGSLLNILHISSERTGSGVSRKSHGSGGVCFSGMISRSRMPDKRWRNEYSPDVLKSDTIWRAALAQSLKGAILIPPIKNPFTGEYFLVKAGLDG
jgi:hypothetical protein